MKIKQLSVSISAAMLALLMVLTSAVAAEEGKQPDMSELQQLLQEQV